MSLLPLFPHLFAMKSWNWMSWSYFFNVEFQASFFTHFLPPSSRGSLVPLHFYFILFLFISIDLHNCVVLFVRIWSPLVIIFYTVHGDLLQEYCRGLPFPPPVDYILSELFTITCSLWVAMIHSFIELSKPLFHDKAVIHEGPWEWGWERAKREWDAWIESLSQWTWVWANSGR